MPTPFPTDGATILQRLIKDVDQMKRLVNGRGAAADPVVDGETITIPAANVTEGALFYEDVEVNEFVTSIGQQEDDAETILTDAELWVVMPSTPICTTTQSSVIVEWDGFGPDGEAVPANFIRLAVHRSLDPLFDADPLVTQVGVMTLPGVLVFSDQIVDTSYFYRFVLHTADGRHSQQSDTGEGIAVAPVAVLDPSQVEEIVNEAVDEANAYTDSVVVTASGNTITMSLSDPSGTPDVGDMWYKTNGTGEIIGQWIGVAGTPNTWSAQTMNGQTLTNLNAGSITTGQLQAGRIAANTIRARELLLADTSNMAEINESYAVGTIFDTTHVITSGWSTRASDVSTYFMFRDQQGPVPIKTGDRIRITFEAQCATPVTASAYLWMYGNATVFQAFSPTIPITATPTVFAREMTVTLDNSGKTTFLIGLQGVAGMPVQLRNVRAYLMNAGELVVDGTITATKIAAQSITAEKIALGTYSTNLVMDPSFEEPYPIVTTGEDHQWIQKDMVATGYVQRVNLPNSGLYSLRLGAAASGDAARVRSGIFPVTPGKTYTVSMAIAKELNVSVAGFYCRIAGGSTKALTEYPAGPFQSFIAFGGEDPNAFENVDPIWISPNLYPYSVTVDANADGIHDGATAYTNGTVTSGVRSVSASGQAISAASLAVGARWGVYTLDLPGTPNFTYRFTARYTGLSGTNARINLVIHAADVAGGGAYGQIGSNSGTAASGVLTTSPAAGNYDTYRVYVWLENSSGTVAATSPAATITGIEMERVDATGLPDPVMEQYERHTSVFTVPAGINYCALRLSCTGATAAQSIFVDDTSCVEIGKGGSELTAAGLRLFGADGNEVGAFVSNRPDYISVTDGTKTLASISQVGAISGQSGSFAGVDTDGDGTPDKGLEIFGTEFLDWLDQFPRGVIAWENFGTDKGPTTSASEMGYGEVGFQMQPGRLYRVQARGMYDHTTAGAGASLRIRMTSADAPADAASPTITSNTLVQIIPWRHSVANADSTFNDFAYIYNETTIPKNVRLLLTYAGAGTAAGAYTRAAGTGGSTIAAPENGVVLSVEDVGPYRAQGGAYNTGGAAVVLLQTYTTTWTSTTAVSYMGSGAKDGSQGAEDMKQGYSSYDGDSKSLWIFPASMGTTLAGVTSDANIIKVRIYLYANHWYNNAGGTALLKRHNYASAPSSSPSMTTLQSSSGWPKPGGRWVDITNASGVKAALRGGTMKGIGVGPAGTTSQTYYGRFNKAGAKIEVTYKK